MATRSSKKTAGKVRPRPPQTPKAFGAGRDAPVPEGRTTGRGIILCLLLTALTVAVFWPAMDHDFIYFDDQTYVTENSHVLGGLSWQGIKWAFSNPVCSNWHPLTVLSHMLDCQLFGLKPWGHHFVNVLFHALNAALIFALLQQLTGATWRSFFVAALFAVHPLRVESVAWVAERKDVLSGAFFLLTLWAYSRYAPPKAFGAEVGSQPRKLSGETGSPISGPLGSGYYWLSLLFFVCGLMSKPMVVTAPFVLLLLDYWPLNRWRNGVLEYWSIGAAKQDSTAPTLHHSTTPILRLFLEKIPFLVLAVVASVVTFEVQKADAVIALETLPIGARVENALISYGRYLGKLFWPTNLTIYYPHPRHWPVANLLLAAGLLLAISMVFFVLRRRSPFLLMGWLWFVGMLVPVLGLVQAGSQAMADRYTYLPSLGVLILTIWGGYELIRPRKLSGWVIAPVPLCGSAAILLCVLLTRHQLGYWKDTESLFRQATAVTKGNSFALYNLGYSLMKKGRYDEAIYYYREAIRLQSQGAATAQVDNVTAHFLLGLAFANNNQWDEAIVCYRKALDIQPGYADAHNNLGNALMAKGQLDEAIGQFQETLRLRPDSADARNNLGNALMAKGQLDAAISQLQEAIRRQPDNAITRYNLGLAYAGLGQWVEAAAQFENAVALQPYFPQARYNLGRSLAELRRWDEAIDHYQNCLALQPDFADAHNSIGLALVARGRWDEAALHYRKALALKPDDPAFKKNLAWLLATCPRADLRNGVQAVQLAQEAEMLHSTNQWDYLDTLAAAYAEAGQLSRAVETAKRALDVASKAFGAQTNAHSGETRARLKLFEQGLPYHEPPSTK